MPITAQHITSRAHTARSKQSKQTTAAQKRHREDRQVNRRRACVWDQQRNSFATRSWEEVCVGDVLLLHENVLVPADAVLLASSGDQGTAYVETSQLDGETNLKARQALPCTQFECTDDCGDVLEPLLGASVRAEAPNNRIHAFEGALVLGDGSQHRLEPAQLLLRGCQLRNTRCAVAAVVYTGPDTKLMRNQRAAPLKRSGVERRANRFIGGLFVVEVLLALVCAAGSTLWLQQNRSSAWYLMLESESLGARFALNTITFVILFNNLIPISLYVSVEVVRVLQAYFIDNDRLMRHRGVYAHARTSNLNEELGQVEYIFSDKTGTLTQNVMQFRMCSIGGVSYGTHSTDYGRLLKHEEDGEERDFATTTTSTTTTTTTSAKRKSSGDGEQQEAAVVSKQVEEAMRKHVDIDDPVLAERLKRAAAEGDSTLQRFMLALALCHTVVVDNALYQSSSPDECALAYAAKHFGYEFVGRTPNTETVRLRGRRSVTFELLCTLEFTSARKRMSVVVREPDGRLVLYCKGADSVVYPRLAADDPTAAQTQHHLDEYAAEGLRTLCVAYKHLEAREYEQWRAEYDQAAVSIGGREEALERACERIERGLTLLGATAIEDKLQDGVPETIRDLAAANIKVWMLTGDKRETAANIAHACRLFTRTMVVHTIDTTTTTSSSREDTVRQCIEDALREVAEDEQRRPHGLVIESSALECALGERCGKAFAELACACRGVVCCRCTPLQKARVVQLVRQHAHSTTLAVGDGANDVSMIQAADVGVGINGEEGLQAARSADYAVAQFRFLKRLLLVHGRFSYRRISLVMLYTFYRNIALYLIQFWYCCFNGFSGQSLFDRWTLAVYNILFTGVPIIAFGAFDQDVSDATVYRFPSLYSQGQQNEIFNARRFAGWVANGAFHSCVVFFAALACGVPQELWRCGWNGDLYAFGHALYTAAMLVVSIKLFMETNYWTWANHVVYWGCLAVYFVWGAAYGCFWYFGINLGDTYFHLALLTARAPRFWLALLLATVACLARDIAWKLFVPPPRFFDSLSLSLLTLVCLLVTASREQ